MWCRVRLCPAASASSNSVTWYRYLFHQINKLRFSLLLAFRAGHSIVTFPRVHGPPPSLSHKPIGNRSTGLSSDTAFRPTLKKDIRCRLVLGIRNHPTEILRLEM